MVIAIKSNDLTICDGLNINRMIYILSLPPIHSNTIEFFFDILSKFMCQMNVFYGSIDMYHDTSYSSVVTRTYKMLCLHTCVVYISFDVVDVYIWHTEFDRLPNIFWACFTFSLSLSLSYFLPPFLSSFIDSYLGFNQHDGKRFSSKFERLNGAIDAAIVNSVFAVVTSLPFSIIISKSL